MLKNYNYMLTIMLYPFVLILSYLKLTNIIKSDIYTYLIIIMLIIFIPSFIMSLYSASEDILKSKNKWHIVLLILLSVFYLPIYYTKHVSKEEKYLGYLLFVITIPLTILTINSSCNSLGNFLTKTYRNIYALNPTFGYYSNNKLFSVEVDASFRCNDKDIGDYVISCDRLRDDSFIGIYSYDVTGDTEEENLEKLDFHLKQTIDYIKENNFEYTIEEDNDIIKIEYNDNAVLVTQKDYMVGDSKYSLIILKEIPRANINYDEYQKMIDSIKFLNYNVGVSS